MLLVGIGGFFFSDMVFYSKSSESWYFIASVINGGRELSPSSASCGGFVQKTKGSGEKRQLAHGSTKSPAEHH